MKLFEATGVEQLDLKRAIAGLYLFEGESKTWEAGVIISIEHFFFSGGSISSSVSLSGTANSESTSFSCGASIVNFWVNDVELSLLISFLTLEDEVNVESSIEDLLANGNLIILINILEIILKWTQLK